MRKTTSDFDRYLANDPNGNNVFHYMAMNNGLALFDSEKASTMLATPNKEGKTPVHVAAQYDNNGFLEQVAKFLKEHKAVDHAGTEKLVNAIRDRNNRTPLHVAAKKGSQATVATLLGMGFDPNQPDIRGVRPLDTASIHGKVGALKALKVAGVDINAQDNEYSYSQLHLAATEGNIDAVNALLTAGADPYRKDNQGHTALDFAAMNGRIGVLKALKQAGVDIDAQDNEYSYSQLHLAATEGNIDAVNALLTAGADPNLVDDQGNTALHLAARAGAHDVYTAMLEKGAKPTIKNDDGHTAADIVTIKAKKAAEVGRGVNGHSSWVNMVSKKSPFRSGSNVKKMVNKFEGRDLTNPSGMGR